MATEPPRNENVRPVVQLQRSRAATVGSSGVLSKDGNSFGLIRMVLSFMVITSHSWSIGGFGTEPLLSLSHHNVTLGTLAVLGFFALSGVLVGRSAERLSPGTYLWHRCRRILPGFWACLIVTAFGFGALIVTVRGLPLQALSTPASATATTFVTRNFTLGLGQLTLGSVLEGLPFPAAINGSLWSLVYEFACYLTVLAVVRMWIASGRRNAVLIAITTLTVVMSLVVAAAPGPGAGFVAFPVLGRLESYQFFTLWAVFLIGALVGLFAERIPLTPQLVAIAGVLSTATLLLGWFRPVGSLLLPYLLVGVGLYLPTAVRSIGRRHDLSYGLYLYGFPVGQLLVATRFHWSGLTLALATCATTSLVAAGSWFGVERPMLGRHRAQSADSSAARK